MAVVTGQIFNSLIFGGVNSADYGIYITGEAVYNAPKRSVEMVAVPGRNGEVAVDNGRYENIEVKYPAGTFGDDGTDFRKAISDFRNAIISQVGYKRLTDTYHPDEYRMAVYVDGLEAEPVRHHNGTAAEFDLVFNCKPQRWLTAGETPVTMANGDTLTNPSLFDASPLLAASGYGTVSFNGYDVEVVNETYGEIVLSGPLTGQRGASTPLSLTKFNEGDIVTVNNIICKVYYKGSSDQNILNTYYTARPTKKIGLVWIRDRISAQETIVTLSKESIDFVVGQRTKLTDIFEVETTWRNTSTGVETTKASTFTVEVGFSNNHFSFSLATDSLNALTGRPKSVEIESLVGISTQSILGDPTYIDCDLGEAYKYEGGELITLNAKIQFGSDLPTLAPGENEVTFDDTITDLKITPRWWKI